MDEAKLDELVMKAHALETGSAFETREHEANRFDRAVARLCYEAGRLDALEWAIYEADDWQSVNKELAKLRKGKP